MFVTAPWRHLHWGASCCFNFLDSQQRKGLRPWTILKEVHTCQSIQSNRKAWWPPIQLSFGFASDVIKQIHTYKNIGDGKWLFSSPVWDVQNIFQSVCCVGALETDKEEDENSMRLGLDRPWPDTIHFRERFWACNSWKRFIFCNIRLQCDKMNTIWEK